MFIDIASQQCDTCTTSYGHMHCCYKIAVKWPCKFAWLPQDRERDTLYSTRSEEFVNQRERLCTVPAVRSLLTIKGTSLGSRAKKCLYIDIILVLVILSSEIILFRNILTFLSSLFGDKKSYFSGNTFYMAVTIELAVGVGS